MTFKSALDIDCGIRYMYDNLCIISSCGRKLLLDSTMMTTRRHIEAHHSRLNDIYDKEYKTIMGKLMYIKDIHNTINRLDNGVILDDIEFFEIKHLAIISDEIRHILNEQHITAVNLPTLHKVVEILDPDNLNIPSFYIYDSYSDTLRELRKQVKALQGNGAELPEEHRLQLASLQQQCADVELEIREKLSQALQQYAPLLQEALHNLSRLDLLIAQVEQIKQLGLCIPTFTQDGNTYYKGMFNPAVKDYLSQQGKEYMPVDISFGNEAVCIIGANMGGKSVALKTLALNQLLAQYGFGVAAQECCINVVEEIALCIGDEQNIAKGISSFAAEILAINKVIQGIRAGKNILALIDEPARTTNPIEGTALVEGLLQVISHNKGGFILTTHYNIKNNTIKRYKVKGLKDGVMDYTLVETHCGDVPHEAIAIAQSLGIDTLWIEYTKSKLNN